MMRMGPSQQGQGSRRAGGMTTVSVAASCFGCSTSSIARIFVMLGGMEVSEAKRLKALEAENAKLKKMLAEHMLDVATLKEMLGKNF